MSKRAVALACVAALTLVATGCGSSSRNESASKPLSKDGFVKQANATFCAGWKEITNAAAASNGTELVDAFRRFSTRLEALTPPADLEDAYATYLADTKRQLAKFAETGGDFSKIEALLEDPGFAALDKQVKKDAGAAGLTVDASTCFTAAPGAGGSTGRSASKAGLIAFESNSAGPTDKHWDIYVMNADGSNLRRLTRKGGGQPAWSPDGKSIAFTSKRNGNLEIYVMEAGGGSQHRLTRNRVPDSTPAWSPDGKQIAFTRGGDCDSKCDIYVMNARGGNQRLLARMATSPSWSPDGRRIAFWSGRDFGSHVYVMNADGSGARNLTPSRDPSWGPDWSPDGKTILFADGSWIYRVDADGGSMQVVAPATGYWIDEPAWSPDGTQIVYFSDANGPGGIYVMNADGTRQVELTSEGDNHNPDWQPLPRRG